MASKSKQTKDSTVVISGFFAVLIATVGALFASPWLVEYFRKSPSLEAAPGAISIPRPDAPSMAVSDIAARGWIAQEQCLSKSWDAFNKARYESAIKFAEQCIDRFGRTADRAQEKLESDREPLPPTGTVDDSEKQAILKRRVLNDVATAYFIKGQAAEYLSKQNPNSQKFKDIAKEAYEATCHYKHGRTWDPRGWFWSPCEAASEHLTNN